MPKQSAGILLYRIKNNKPEVFLCHPGGPFYKKKNSGIWTIPKGEFNNEEEPLVAAKREFKEETGQEVNGNFIPLKPVRYKNGKTVYAWALESEIDAASIKSNLFPMEWPPKSGKYIDVPEVDRGEWFSIETARQKIIPALTLLIDELIETVIK